MSRGMLEVGVRGMLHGRRGDWGWVLGEGGMG